MDPKVETPAKGMNGAGEDGREDVSDCYDWAL